MAEIYENDTGHQTMLKAILIGLVLLVLFWVFIGKELFIVWYSGVDFEDDDKD